MVIGSVIFFDQLEFDSLQVKDDDGTSIKLLRSCIRFSVEEDKMISIDKDINRQRDLIQTLVCFPSPTILLTIKIYPFKSLVSFQIYPFNLLYLFYLFNPFQDLNQRGSSTS